jgi:hypothetical protein
MSGEAGHDCLRCGARIGGLPDRAPRQRCGWRHRQSPARGVATRFWSPTAAPAGRTPGGDDQLALRLRQGADRRRLVRAGDHTIGPGFPARGRRAPARFRPGRRAGSGSRPDRRGPARSAPSPPGSSAPLPPLPVAAARTTCGSPCTVRKSRSYWAMPRTAASIVAPMSKSFISRKTRLPCSCFSSFARAKAAAGQHPQPDLVKADGIAKTAGQIQPLHDIGHVKRHDQTVIGHEISFALGIAASCGAGAGLSSRRRGDKRDARPGKAAEEGRDDLFRTLADRGSRRRWRRRGGPPRPLGAVPTPDDFDRFRGGAGGFRATTRRRGSRSPSRAWWTRRTGG